MIHKQMRSLLEEKRNSSEFDNYQQSRGEISWGYTLEN